MSTDINLLLHKDEESLKRKKRVRILYFIAVILLIVNGTIPLIIFLLIQMTDISSIKKEQKDTISKISQLRNRQVKLSVVENRINNIQEILKTRKDLFKVMSSILAKTPDKMLIEDMEVNEQFAVVTAQSVSLSSIGEFINNLTDMVRKKEIISVLTLDSLVFEKEKNYYQISIKSDL